MAIIKKIGTFIASRALYLALGVFLAASMMAFAAWDDARTGGSGELSENNWNELVTMIEANIGGGSGVQYITTTRGFESGKDCGGAYPAAYCPAGWTIVNSWTYCTLASDYEWWKNDWRETLCSK